MFGTLDLQNKLKVFLKRLESSICLVDMLHISYGWHVGFEKNIEAALEKAGVYYLLIDTP